MRREQLEHVLRAASQIADDPDVVVIGSQSILAAIPEDRLPREATASMEVDVAFFDDLDNRKSDQVDGAIGELSPFHEMNGYYAQGVSVSTATLPRGWRDRLVLVESQSTQPGRGYALDPHDCVVSKLVAGREKDHAFANALIEAGLIDPTTVAARIDTLEVDPKIPRSATTSRVCRRSARKSMAGRGGRRSPGFVSGGTRRTPCPRGVKLGFLIREYEDGITYDRAGLQSLRQHPTAPPPLEDHRRR